MIIQGKLKVLHHLDQKMDLLMNLENGMAKKLYLLYRLIIIILSNSIFLYIVRLDHIMNIIFDVLYIYIIVESFYNIKTKK